MSIKFHVSDDDNATKTKISKALWQCGFSSVPGFDDQRRMDTVRMTVVLDDVPKRPVIIALPMAKTLDC